jgi:uncharacterized protein (DUF1778 family)
MNKENKTETINIRLTETQKSKILKAADKERRSVSEYILVHLPILQK